MFRTKASVSRCKQLGRSLHQGNGSKSHPKCRCCQFRQRIGCMTSYPQCSRLLLMESTKTFSLGRTSLTLSTALGGSYALVFNRFPGFHIVIQGTNFPRSVVVGTRYFLTVTLLCGSSIKSGVLSVRNLYFSCHESSDLGRGRDQSPHPSIFIRLHLSGDAVKHTLTRTVARREVAVTEDL